MVDIKKINLGDVVTVRGRVCTIDTNPDHMGIALHEQWWTGENIVSHTPKPREFKPGDRVRWKPNPYAIWNIEAVKDGQAWLRSQNNWHTVKISDLHYADESE